MCVSNIYGSNNQHSTVEPTTNILSTIKKFMHNYNCYEYIGPTDIACISQIVKTQDEGASFLVWLANILSTIKKFMHNYKCY